MEIDPLNGHVDNERTDSRKGRASVKRAPACTYYLMTLRRLSTAFDREHVRANVECHNARRILEPEDQRIAATSPFPKEWEAVGRADQIREIRRCVFSQTVQLMKCKADTPTFGQSTQQHRHGWRQASSVFNDFSQSICPGEVIGLIPIFRGTECRRLRRHRIRQSRRERWLTCRCVNKQDVKWIYRCRHVVMLSKGRSSINRSSARIVRGNFSYHATWERCTLRLANDGTVLLSAAGIASRVCVDDTSSDTLCRESCAAAAAHSRTGECPDWRSCNIARFVPARTRAHLSAR